MREKIELQAPLKPSEFTANFLRWVVTFTCVTLLLIFVMNKTYNTMGESVRLRDLLLPTQTIASWMAVQQGVAEFQGNGTLHVQPVRKFQVFVSLIVPFVLGPTMFFFGWRNSVQKKKQTEKLLPPTVPIHVPSIFFVLGGVLMFSIAIQNLIFAIEQPHAFKNLHHENVVTQNRDAMTIELGEMYARCVQYFYLPHDAHGGGRTFRTQQATDDSTAAVTFMELGRQQKTANGIYYTERLTTDTILVIYGIGKIPLANNSYRNVNGTRGFAQYKMIIMPSHFDLIKEN